MQKTITQQRVVKQQQQQQPPPSPQQQQENIIFRGDPVGKTHPYVHLNLLNAKQTKQLLNHLMLM